MPRITRIRAANIQYDNAKKQLPDITIDASGMDTVLLLANGGGKTLFLQLLLQTILPNEKMGGRSISDLLISNRFTGHIAAEWILDDSGDKNHHLCTGFCFSNGTNMDQRIRYFNYYFDYHDFSGLNITTLPLIREDDRGLKRSIGYMEFKKFLNEETNESIQVFEQQKNRYQDRLRHYQILPEEWKNIRDTNDSEGGVDEFFKKSKTTRQLLSNLLIPGVEDMVFQSEDKKKELVKAFYEYRNMLIEIPLIKKNINDFRGIRENAEGLVAKVKDLDETQKEKKNKINELVILAKTFDKFKENAEKELEKLKEEKQKKNLELNELIWKKESFSVFEQEIEYARVFKELENIKKDLVSKGNQLEKAEENENRLKALHYYWQITNARDEIKKYETQLDIMDKNIPELKEELKEKKVRMVAGWETENNSINEKIKEHQRVVKSAKEKSNSLELSIKEKRELESDLREKKGKANSWLDNFKESQKKLMNEIPQSEVLNPYEGLKNHENLLYSLKSNGKNTLERIEEIKIKRESIEEEISQFQLDKNNYKNKENLAVEKLREYKDDDNRIRGLLAEKQIYIKSLLENKEKAWLQVKDGLKNIQDDLIKIQSKSANLKEKWLTLENKDYYIPHEELLNIKDFLEKKGIYVILGSEWLASQDLHEDKKEGYINNQPLLPYTIILEENQVNQVKTAMKQVKEWSFDLPILFLVKDAESLKIDSIETNIKKVNKKVNESDGNNYNKVLPLIDKLLFFKPTSYSIFTSINDFNEYKEKIREKITILDNKIQPLKEEEEKYVHIRENLKSFYNNYSAEKIKGWEDFEKECKEKAADLDDKIQKSKKEKQELKNELNEKEKVLAVLNERVSQKVNLIGKIKDFIEYFQLYPDKLKELENYNNSLEEIEEKISNLEDEKKNNENYINNKNLSLRELSRQLEEHKKDYNKYQLEKAYKDSSKDESIKAFISYEDIKAEVITVLEKMEKGQNERGNIEKLLANSREREQDGLEGIKETGIEENWIQQNLKWVSKEEVKESESATRKKKKEYDEIKDKLNECKSNVKSIKSVLNDRINRIKNNFNKEPYLEFSKENYKLEYNNILEGLEKLNIDKDNLEANIEEKKEWKRNNQDALESITDKYGAEAKRLWNKIEPLTDKEWEGYKVKPKIAVNNWEKSINMVKEKLENQEKLVEKRFQKYLAELNASDNPKVKQFIRDVGIIMEDSRIFNYDFVETQFLRIFEGLDAYQKQYELTLKEREKNQEILIDLCLRRAKTIYESIMEIPKNSKVKIFQRDIQVIQMDWRALEGQEAYEKIYSYLMQVLQDLQKWKQEGHDEDEMDRRAEEKLKTRNLIQEIAPLEDCRITVYKPREESIIGQQKISYSPWDEVCRWSGGEEYSIYITMFMIMTSHIRQQIQGNRKVWKVIVADNPFGRASSHHILETVFQVAKSNRIQLICMTAHKQDSILQRFPVVYSMQLRKAYGKEVMKAEQIETGFYRYTPVSEGTQLTF